MYVKIVVNCNNALHCTAEQFVHPIPQAEGVSADVRLMALGGGA